jgi:hypothetical protein
MVPFRGELPPSAPTVEPVGVITQIEEYLHKAEHRIAALTNHVADFADIYIEAEVRQDDDTEVAGPSAVLPRIAWSVKRLHLALDALEKQFERLSTL